MQFLSDNFYPSIKYNFEDIYFGKRGVAVDNLTVTYDSMPGTTVEVNRLSFIFSPKENSLANFDVFINGGKLISDLNYVKKNIPTIKKTKDKKDLTDFCFNIKITNFYIQVKNIFIENASGNAAVSRNEMSAKLSGENFFDGSSFLTFNRKNDKYSLELGFDLLDAAKFCKVFKLNKNRMTGKFTGNIKTVFVKGNVESLKGKLYSEGKGKLFFSEAEKYVAAMDNDINKVLIQNITDQLKNYNYLSCDVLLNYIPKKTNTIITFDFDGEVSDYKFPIYYHATWLDAIKFISSFK